jgi:uncharacterized protein YbaP (TraB family)
VLAKGQPDPTMKTFLAGLLAIAGLGVPAAAQDAHPGTAVAAGDAAVERAPHGPGPDIVQAYEPDPAVWLLQDQDTRIYLLGTVHVLPEGFRWRSLRIDRIVAEAEELIIESSDEEAVDEDPRIARMIGSLAKRPRVSERLSPENGAKWLALGESLGVDAEVFDRLPPLLSLLGIGLSMSREEAGSERRYGVEAVLQHDFRAAGKPIGAIESATEVFLSLLALDEAVLIKELDRELSLLGGKDPRTFLFAPRGKEGPGSALAMEHRWAQGDEVELGPEAFGGNSFGRSMDKALLDRRNRAWAGWLERRLEQPGTILVAVGAAHLAGRNSVQAMLAGRGLETERLD